MTFSYWDDLFLLGYFTTFTHEPNIQVRINDERTIPVEIISFPQRDNFSLNFNYGFNHNFKVSIPIEEDMKIEFRVDDDISIPEYSHISRLSKVSKYMLSDKFIVRDMDDSILIHWIFMDLPYRADDNAFQLFKYAVEANDKDIDKYFAISKHDYHVQDVEIMANKYRSSSRMFKIKRLLGLGNQSSEYQKVADVGFDIAYRSIRHRLYALFAEVIVSSNPDNNIIYPFWGNFPFLSGLVKSKTVFLQHGVTKDDTSSWLNKYDKNLDMIVTVSDAERQSFIDNDYGYPADSIKVLGFPRFDKLEKLEDKKEIVVMPTWRRHYTNLSDENFMKTTFFNAFNNLLNDDDLLDFLESKGYRLVFKPHPNLYKFIHLFDRNNDVDFIDRDYSEIFNHSSLLITDYSSVFFDFAYLKKPVIYYHYGKDYHFDVESGYFDYDEMGFGPVAKTSEELRNDIISCVLHDCEMEDVYKQRVDEFFKFNDHENSKRVYEAIRKMKFNH